MSPSFGRGAMTNSWSDLQNAQVFLIAGSNCAENHPIAMRWINRAKAKGAKMIVVDPRFTRTASEADIFAQIRPGTDIAYLGAIINYIIANKLYDEAYVLNYTNALLKVNQGYKFDEGLFSGFDAKTRKYGVDSWGYQLGPDQKPLAAAALDDPDSVFSQLKAHYSRYSLETAEKITGIPAKTIEMIAETFAKNKPGTILYALGMTQHTTAVQGIRAYAIIQLLLGNIGRAGGGVNALRGEPNVQGSTDMANLFNNLPGYVPAPISTDKNLQDYAARNGSIQVKPLVSLLKAWYGENATKADDYAFDYLPKINPSVNATMVKMFEMMEKGQFKLLFNMGSNSLVSIANRQLVRSALTKLDMMVVSDLFEVETAQFWREPGVNPAEIKTEVIMFPAAFVYEKAGSLTNSSRWIQWKEAAIKPLGEAKPDLDLLDALFKRIRRLYATSTEAKDTPILKARWDYGEEPSALKVLQELSGYDETTGKLLSTLADYLKAPVGDVSTGCWIYAGVTGNGNLAARRNNADPSHLGLFNNWSFAWPANIRILYNRASCDLDGQPVDPERKLVWWDGTKSLWVGNDGPDVVDKTKGPKTPEGKQSFRMNPEGLGRLFAAKYTSGLPVVPPAQGQPVIGIRPAGLCVDGPLPEFYEPTESPTENLLHPQVSASPTALVPSAFPEIQKMGKAEDFPYVLTTYGVVEQFCAGGVTRNIPWLNELMPEPFAEMSKNLAGKIGVHEGDKVEVSSARGKVTVRCLVTDRLQTYAVNGRKTETIGMPWSWGFASLSPGPSTNELTIASLDPGAGTPETKVCLVNVRRA
ncbi:formate dehydrogenase, nitrate-inducible, major subunit precursor [Peptococcaceae bacterium CEB3]|nr:formate dehydrogenase, nitrate-inducible, major subunit precursor [Peptococcaceae bacterium CEB3]